MYRDHPDNILGVNTADNLFSSSSVAANADGSMIERLEYIQGIVSALTAGSNILQGAQETATSTTSIKISGLAGFGDDFFNNHWYMQVLHNNNSAGNAPEHQVRQITDYVSSTGTFTCTAFSAAVETDDLCVVLHESWVAIGRDDADNVIATTNVVANADGSILERLEYIQTALATVDDYVDTEIAAIQAVTDALPDAGALSTMTAAVQAVYDRIAGTDSATNVLGADDADNGFASTNVVANNDGSVLERLEGLLVAITAVDDYVDTEIAAIKAVTDVIPDAGALTTLAGEVTAIKAVTDVIPDAGALTTLAGDVTAIKAVTDVIPDAGAVTTMSGEVTAIKAVTDVLPDAGALTTMSGEVTAIKAVTDVLPDAGALTALQAAVDNFAAAGGDGAAVVTKSVTFSNTAADVNLFTITAGVTFKLFAFCTTNCESAGTCTIGVDLGSTAIIADTASTDLEANDIWHDATPDASVELESVASKYVAYGGTIVLDLEAAHQVDSGAITFVCIYTPLTATGAIAAA